MTFKQDFRCLKIKLDPLSLKSLGQSFRRQIGSLPRVLSVVLIGLALMIFFFEKSLQFMISGFEESVSKSNNELAAAYRQIEDQAYRDFLTG